MRLIASIRELEMEMRMLALVSGRSILTWWCCVRQSQASISCKLVVFIVPHIQHSATSNEFMEKFFCELWCLYRDYIIFHILSPKVHMDWSKSHIGLFKDLELVRCWSLSGLIKSETFVQSKKGSAPQINFILMKISFDKLCNIQQQSYQVNFNTREYVNTSRSIWSLFGPYLVKPD